jgi:hypothetical protein
MRAFQTALSGAVNLLWSDIFVETHKPFISHGVEWESLSQWGDLLPRRLFQQMCDPLRGMASIDGLFRFSFHLILAFILFSAPRHLQAQDVQPPVAPPPAVKQPVESEIILEGMGSYGNWKILASGYDCKLYTGGFEYDRHSWGHLLFAQFDYTAEFLPYVLLREPAKADIWGNPMTSAQKHVPGLGVSPIGFRLMWFEKRKFKPYVSVKGGLLAFPIKILSSDASYVNLSFQTGVGLQAKLTDRLDLRMGMFNDFHFSDAFVVPVDPGLDVMNANLGLSYHLGKRSRAKLK